MERSWVPALDCCHLGESFYDFNLSNSYEPVDDTVVEDVTGFPFQGRALLENVRLGPQQCRQVCAFLFCPET